jgi:hypothetical protein
MGRRLAVIVVGAVGLAAVDLAVKTGLPTSPWLLHERSIGWVVLSAALVAGCLALARVPSRFVAVAAGLSAAGALGNLISAMGHEGAVPDPLLLGGAANGVAFNLADVFVVLGLLGLVPALVATSVQNRRSLIPPRSWERRLRRKIGGSGADRGAIRADASTAAKPGVRTMLIICAAAALLAGAFLFAANIHTGESLLSRIHPAAKARALQAPPPLRGSGVEGWIWPERAPGFRFGSEERFWNGTQLSLGRRATIEASAEEAGLAPGATRVVKEVRALPSRDLIALVAAPAQGRGVCLAVSGRGLPRQFTCVRQASRAAASSAFLAVSIWNGPLAGRTAHVLDLVGVARGDVSRIDLRLPGLGSWRVYERSAEFAWGAFALGVDLPRAWVGSLQIHGASGRLVTVQLRSSAAGRRLLLPVAKCGEPAC